MKEQDTFGELWWSGKTLAWSIAIRYMLIKFHICFEWIISILLYSNRKLTRVVAQVFIPTTIMVVLSWFSFLIPPTSYPGRVGILVTLILVLINIMIMVIETSPTVSGICALIIWIIISLSMVRYVIWYLYLQLCIYKRLESQFGLQYFCHHKIIYFRLSWRF